jgi:hypothetical protein
MSAMCCIGFLAVIFFTVKKMGAVGEPVIPFVMIIVAGGLYRLVARLETNKLLVNYSGCLIVAEIVALLTFYASGNYYVVQSLSNLLHGTTKPIAFGPFFWAWTILIPLVYLLPGVRKKDVILLRTGLILIAAAVVTVRNYYHLLQIDLMLTFSGIFVLGLVYALMKYLTMHKHGFTLEVATDAHMLDHLKVESLIIGETFSPAQVAPEGAKFGGGDFGGGGSSGGF